MPRFFDDLARFGDAIALIAPAEDTRVTYAELAALVAERRATLPATRSLVFIEAGNTVASIVNYLATLAAGHPAHVMESFGNAKGQALVETYRPNLLLSDAGATAHDATPHDLHPDLMLLLSTSGSTGSPKFVKLSGGNLQSNTESIADYLALTAADRAFCHLKPYYSFGMSILNSHLAVGASVVLSLHSMIDEDFWSDLRTHEATSFSGVPYNFETLMRRGFDPADYPALRYATQAGGKLDAELVTHFAESFEAAGKAFFVMYGQTEAAPRMSYLPPALARQYPNSIGVAVPGGKLYLVDDKGAEIAGVGPEGELAYEGPNVMMGYATEPGELAGDETPPRLVTGDIARRLTPELFQIVGRSSRFVKPFGVRLGLDEVQSFVKLTHPVSAATGTDEMLVIGLEGAPDQALADQIRSACAERFSLPRNVIRVAFLERLPLLPTGKVDYRGVLEEATRQAKPGFLQRMRGKIYEALGFDDRSAETVLEAFQNVLQVPGITPEQSFEDLGGDSLSYVTLSLELEELLGAELPEAWTPMTIAALEALRERAMLQSA